MSSLSGDSVSREGLLDDARDESEEIDFSQKRKLKYRLIIRNIAVSAARFENFHIQFTFGGDYKKIDNRNKGGEIVEVGKPGPRFHTPPLRKENMTGNSWVYEKSRIFKSTEQLREEFLEIELYTSTCSKRSTLGKARLNLYDIANGSIQQELEIRKWSESGKKEKEIVCRLTFDCYLQENVLMKINLTNWRADNIFGVSETYNPMIKMRMNRSFWEIFKGDRNYFKKKTRSEVLTNVGEDDEVVWKDVGSMVYGGILSELESEEIYVTILDRSETGKTVIGTAVIDMRGFLTYGYLEARVDINRELATTNERRKKLIEGSFVSGLVDVEGLSATKQYGDSFFVKPKQQYLGVYVEKCSNLNSGSNSGFSNPFVSVQFAGARHRTRIIQRNLEPIFDMHFYFHVKRNPLHSGPVKFFVFDASNEGDAFLGYVSIDIKDILESSVAQAGQGKNQITTRVLDKTLPLYLNGAPTAQTISLKLWFHPDLPEEDDRGKDDGGSDESAERDDEAFSGLVTQDILRRYKSWKKKVKKGNRSLGKFPISGTDEMGQQRFIPSYMFRALLPRGYDDANKLFRMVNLIQTENDEDSFGGASDVWCTMDFFLTMKKGSQEEHAMLLTSLFIGLGLDAYFCYGKAVFKESVYDENKEEKEHSWVMTRDPDGSVTFWETLSFKKYVIKDAWSGATVLDVHGDDDEDQGGSSIESSDVEMESDVGDEEKKEEVSDVDDDEKKEEVSHARSGGDDDSDLLHIPYTQIEIIATHENVWINTQESLHPAKIRYDFFRDGTTFWEPFIDNVEFDSPVARLASTPRLLAKYPESYLEDMSHKIVEEIRAAFVNYNHQEHRKVHVLTSTIPILCNLAKYYEIKSLKGIKVLNTTKGSSDVEHLEFLRLKGDLTASSPAGYSFKGYPYHFKYHNPARIRKWIMENTDHYKFSDSETLFSFGAHITGYYNEIVSVWVIIGVYTPSRDNKDDEDSTSSIKEE